MNAEIIDVRERATGNIYQCVAKIIWTIRKEIHVLYDIGTLENGTWKSIEIVDENRLNLLCEYVSPHKNDR